MASITALMSSREGSSGAARAFRLAYSLSASSGVWPVNVMVKDFF